jgi:hypothetical protein
MRAYLEQAPLVDAVMRSTLDGTSLNDLVDEQLRFAHRAGVKSLDLGFGRMLSGMCRVCENEGEAHPLAALHLLTQAPRTHRCTAASGQQVSCRMRTSWSATAIWCWAAQSTSSLQAWATLHS